MRIYGLFYITTIIPMHETDNETDLSVYFSVLTTFNSINMEEGGFLKQCCIYLIPLMFCHIAEYKRLTVLSLSLRMQSVGLALEELLVTAQKQGCLTVGIYESAKLLNVWVESINFGLCFSSHCPNWSPPDMWIQFFPHFSSFLFPLRDPDSVVLCVLAADDENDVALQIHFTLLQSFCCDSGITILRVSGFQRLQRLLGAVDANRNQEEHRDLHCMLVTVCWLSIVATSYVTERQMVIFFMHNFQLKYCTFSFSSPCDFYSYFAGSIQIERWTWFFFSPTQNPQAEHCRLQEVGTYCQESRRLDQWVPELVLQERWRVCIQELLWPDTDTLKDLYAQAGMTWSVAAPVHYP